MRKSITAALARAAFVLTALGVASTVAVGQRTGIASRYSAADLKKLHWIEGRWRGAASGKSPFFEQYRFVNDSTLEITYYNDSAFTKSSGGGRVYLTAGRIYHATGPSLWGASRIDESGAFFIPQQNANNSVIWTFNGPDSWTATLRSSATGTEQVTVYEMRRIK